MTPNEPFDPLDPSEIFKATVRTVNAAKAMYATGYEDGRLRGRAEAYAEMQGPLTSLSRDIVKVRGEVIDVVAQRLLPVVLAGGVA